MNEFKKKIFFLIDEHKFGFVILCFLFILTSILDVLSIGLIFPYLFVLIDDPEGDIFYKYFFYKYFEYDFYFYFLSILLILSFIGRNIIYYISQKKIFEYSYNIQEKLRYKLFSKYIKGKYKFILDKKSENLIQNIIKNIDSFIEIVLIAFLQITSQIFFIFLITILLFVSNPVIFIYLIIFLILFVIYYFYRYRKRFIILGKYNVDFQKKIISLSSQAIKGIKEIKIYKLEKFFLSNLKEKSSKYASALVSYKSSIIVPRMTLETMVIFFVVIISVYNFSNNKQLTSIIPSLSLFAVSIIRLLPSINIFTTSILSIRYATPVIDDLYYDLLDHEDSIFKIPNNTNYFGDFNDFEIQNLSFLYDKSSSLKILEDITLKISKNKIIGIYGISGSGKTTLMNIMLGLLESDSGKILINKIEINKNNLGDWQNKIAYVPQESFLIEGTISENIAIGKSAYEIDKIKLKKAIELSALSGFVNKLDKGLDTILNNDATNISGGEKQRISFARSIYFEKEIIFLDEPTSFLDKKTEKILSNSINKLKNNKTFIVISHNPSFIDQCDEIYKIENKKLLKIK